VAALVKCGRLLEAEAALERTIQVAAAAQKVPPEGAFGAMIRGYRQTGQQEKAVAVLRRLLQLGVKPADVVWEQVIDLCLQAGDYKAARQVVRAMELTGMAVDKAAYDARFQRHQQQQQLMQKWQLDGQGAGVGGKGSQGVGMRKGSPLGSGSEGSDEAEQSSSSSSSSVRNPQVERLKWWLGLPNSYYNVQASQDET
jgi:pentatricopeptide repeat protein